MQGELKGHKDWITSIAVSRSDPNYIVSASRDKTIIIWKLYGNYMISYIILVKELNKCCRKGTLILFHV